MGNNIFSSIEQENKIFKNESVFNQNHIPDEIIHREKEIKEIAYSLKGVPKGNGENIFLYGTTGTGKTTSAKYVLKELEKYSRKVIGIYINCWYYSTRYSVLNQIAYSLDNMVPRRGLAPDQLENKIIEISKREGITPIVILDEIDVLNKRGEDGVLYDLLRIGEGLNGKIISILITNENDFVTKLDRRIKSSFTQHSLKFAPYRPSELKDILLERAKIGLIPRSYDEEIIGACVGFGARNRGDARIAIRLLWAAGKAAERKGNDKIKIEDVKENKENILNEREMEKINSLSKEDRKILNFIGNDWTISSDIYANSSIGKRSVRDILEKLEKLGFVESKTGEPRKTKYVRKIV